MVNIERLAYKCIETLTRTRKSLSAAPLAESPMIYKYDPILFPSNFMEFFLEVVIIWQDKIGKLQLGKKWIRVYIDLVGSNSDSVSRVFISSV